MNVECAQPPCKSAEENLCLGEKTEKVAQPFSHMFMCTQRQAVMALAMAAGQGTRQAAMACAMAACHRGADDDRPALSTQSPRQVLRQSIGSGTTIHFICSQVAQQPGCITSAFIFKAHPPAPWGLRRSLWLASIVPASLAARSTLLCALQGTLFFAWRIRILTRNQGYFMYISINVFWLLNFQQGNTKLVTFLPRIIILKKIIIPYT